MIPQGRRHRRRWCKPSHPKGWALMGNEKEVLTVKKSLQVLAFMACCWLLCAGVDRAGLALASALMF